MEMVVREELLFINISRKMTWNCQPINMERKNQQNHKESLMLQEHSCKTKTEKETF